MLKSGLCSVSFRKLKVDEIIKVCKKAKLDAIEWGGDVHVPVGNLKLAKSIGNKTRKNGLITYSYGSYFRSRDPKEFKKISDTAKALGAKVIRIWAGEKPSKEFNEKEFKQLVKVINDCAKIANGNKQIICFEYHYHTYNDYRKSSLKLLKAINKKNVRTYWQPQYWDDQCSKKLNYKHNIDSIKALAPYVINFHVYNWVGYTKRYSLKLIKSEFKKYLSSSKNNGYAYLEFFKNDDVKECYKDAKVLNEILKELYK